MAKRDRTWAGSFLTETSWWNCDRCSASALEVPFNIDAQKGQPSSWKVHPSSCSALDDRRTNSGQPSSTYLHGKGRTDAKASKPRFLSALKGLEQVGHWPWCPCLWSLDDGRQTRQTGWPLSHWGIGGWTRSWQFEHLKASRTSTTETPFGWTRSRRDTDELIVVDVGHLFIVEEGSLGTGLGQQCSISGLLLLAKKAVLISGISESENKKYYSWREKNNNNRRKKTNRLINDVRITFRNEIPSKVSNKRRPIFT